MQKESYNLCILYDPIHEVYYQTSKSVLKKAQEELDKKLSAGLNVSYDTYIETLTKDWPEEEKQKFYASRDERYVFRLDDPENNRMIVFNECGFTKDGKLLLNFDSTYVLSNERL